MKTILLGLSIVALIALFAALAFSFFTDDEPKNEPYDDIP